MSGWSTSRTTILAARRVLPPDLIVPALASAPRMKLTGPEAEPPLERCSLEERRRGGVAPVGERLLGGARAGGVAAGAGAAAEDDPLAADPVQDRLHRVLDREDEAG